MSEEYFIDPPEMSSDRTELHLTPVMTPEGIDYPTSTYQPFWADADIGQVDLGQGQWLNRELTVPLRVKDVGGTAMATWRSLLQAKVGEIQATQFGVLKRVMSSGGTVYADILSARIKTGGDSLQAIRGFDVNASIDLVLSPESYGDWVELDVMRGTGEIVGVLQEGGRDAVIAGDFPPGNRCRIVVTDTSGNDQRGLIAAFRGRHYDPSPAAALSYEAEDLLALDTAIAVALAGASGGTVVQHSNLATSWTPVVGGAAVAAPPAVRGVGAVASGTAGITPALPAGTTVNDVLLMFLETGNEAVTPPSGWAHVTGSPVAMATGTATRLTVLWKRAAVGEAAPTVADPGDHIVGSIMAVSGCAASGNPWDVTATGTEATSDTSASMPGGTTTVSNCLVLSAIATGTDVASTANASGWTNPDLSSVTELFDTWVIDGNGGGLALASGVRAAEGAYGATTATLRSAAEKAMMTIALKPVQPMTHVGTYRLLARVHSMSGASVCVRSVYDVGDLVAPTENSGWTFPDSSLFYVADLGEVRLDQALVGTHRWIPQIQAMGAAGGEDISIDRVWLVPIDEFMASANAGLQLARGLATFVARDEFKQTSGNLSGKTLPVGGTWRAAGDSDDFTIDTSNAMAKCSAASDSTVGTLSGRVALAGATIGMTNQGASVDFKASAAPNTIGGGLVLRYNGTSDFLRVILTIGADGIVRIGATVYTTSARPKFVTLYGQDQYALGGVSPLGAFARISAVVGANGLLVIGVGTGEATLYRFSGYHSALASGGALASGSCGLFDVNTGAGSADRFYDNFVCWAPSADAVVFANRTVELRTAGCARGDATGMAYGPIVPTGNLPRLPSTAAGSPVESFAKWSHGDLDQTPDSSLDTGTAQAFYQPCWLSVPAE